MNILVPLVGMLFLVGIVGLGHAVFGLKADMSNYAEYKRRDLVLKIIYLGVGTSLILYALITLLESCVR